MSIQHILAADEAILWHGRPNFIAYNLSLSFRVIAALLAAGYVYYTATTSGVCVINDKTADMDTCIATAGWIATGGLALVPLLLLYGYIIWRPVHYYITTRRVVIESGIFGTDYRSILLEKIENTHVRVSPLAKLLGIGTLYAETNQGIIADPERNKKVVDTALRCIPSPYVAYQLLQEQIAKVQNTQTSTSSTTIPTETPSSATFSL